MRLRKQYYLEQTFFNSITMKKTTLVKSLFGLITLLFAVSIAVVNLPTETLQILSNVIHIDSASLLAFCQTMAGTTSLAAVGYYPSTCDDAIPAHNCDPCADREYGRIRSAGFIHKDFVFADDDTTVASEWTRGVDEGKIYIIPETNGELPEPSELTGAGYGDTTETLLGYDFNAKFMDPNYSENVDFYNALIGNRNYKFFYRTSSKVHITQKTVTIIPKTQIQNDLNSEVVWGTSVKWKHDQFPIPFNTPETIFDGCYIPES